MIQKLFIILNISLLVVSLIFAGMPFHNAEAAISNWQKGVSIYSSWNTQFAGDAFKQSVQNAAAAHANYITLIIPIYQSSDTGTDIQNGGNTPTDDALISAITYIHSLGLHVMLKPHLDKFSGGWRASINATDRVTWFKNYTNMLSHYAQIGAQYNVEDFCLGTELIGMSDPTANSTNTANWKTLIANIRKVFPGKLTYSANWGGQGGPADEKNHIQFWDSLDYIGISAYFSLGGNGSVASNESTWGFLNKGDITPLQQRWNKPIVFTEVGYRSVTNSYNSPWDYELFGPVDQQGQANDYQALFEYWNTQGFMQGVQLWDWNGDPNAGGNDTSYTPQHKLAQTTMSTYFNNGGTPPPPVGNPNFTGSSSATTNTITVGQAVDIASTVTNKGAPTSGINVDVEIFNSSGQQVFQKVYDSQNFPQNQNATFHTSWTPSATGSYTVKLGVFNFNWSQNYLWVDNALSLSTGGNPPPPPPPSGVPNFKSTSNATPNPGSLNQPIDIVSNITNSGQAVSGDVVDVEVYDSSSKQVFQKFYDAQSFSQNQTAAYHTSWTPTVAGNYTTKLGIFNSNWTTNYLWVDNAVSISTSGNPPPPPPPPPPPAAGPIDVWWPTNGATVGGNSVPFKGLVENLDVANYDMFWQVNGGPLVAMPTNNTDYPHKEFDTDLTSWTWNGAGPYHINFVAKDKSGNVINQKQVDIMVVH
ncbi:TPA: hypothetical protein DCQ44_01615 [Candidatus Taylorbacteria bacterium]|nr:hypothetical protein [Candidatus Taylorbacteria bacterium]